jgi:excisionase family DNA binding protein
MSQERFAEVRFLTVAEVASIMRVSKMTVYRMVHGGELPAVRVGRSFRVPEDEVQKYLRESYMGTAGAIRNRRWRPGRSGPAFAVPGPRRTRRRVPRLGRGPRAGRVAPRHTRAGRPRRPISSCWSTVVRNSSISKDCSWVQ